jgi:hypothetical protein
MDRLKKGEVKCVCRLTVSDVSLTDLAWEPPCEHRQFILSWPNSDSCCSMAVTFKDGVILGAWFYIPRYSLSSLLASLEEIATKSASDPTYSLGADSRTTTGAYIANRVTDKLTRVHDTIWCCRSGSAADTQAVADIVQYQLGLYAMHNNKSPMTQTAAAMFQEICYANKDQLT